MPPLLNYQGRVAVSGVNFDGTGLFKFALVNATGSTTLWSNDGTSTAGSQPVASVSLPVVKGLYSVLLGDASVAGMTAVPASVFTRSDVRLRVWFSNGSGFQQMAPDQRIGATGYAMNAASVALSSVYATPAEWVAAWGDNSAGGTSVPPGLTEIVQAAAGDGFSVVRRSDGSLAVWGNNTSGQATMPAGLTGTRWIAAGSAHALAVRSDGSVAAWGLNNLGQTTVPGTATGVTQVAAGDHHSIARKSNGSVVVWGDNTFGQTTVPGTATGVTAVAAGNDHCLALRSDGAVVAWGRNDSGQATVPGGLSGVKAVAAGAFHSLALKSDGTVVAWGWNLGGQSTVPITLNGVVDVDGGYSHSVAVKSDGTVVAWGSSAGGRTAVPSGLGSVVSISAQSGHTLAVRASTVPAALARLDADNTFQGSVGIGRAAAINPLEVEGQASKTTAGNWAANSDRRIKTDIQSVTAALETLERVRPVTFRYTPEYLAAHPRIEDVPYYNVIAQEFREAFPDAVKSSGERGPDGSEILQVDTYPAMITALAAVKELHGKVKEQDKAMEASKQELESMKQRLAAMEQLIRTRP